MPSPRMPDSPVQDGPDVAVTSATEAFELLGNETRVSILLALWEAKDPALISSAESEPPLSFTELRDRVGLRHGSQFNYHLNKLTGQFVRNGEAGYSLTESAEQILRAVFAGTLRDHTTLESEPTDAACDRCGAPLVIDYEDGIRYDRCTSCDGFFPESDYPPGTVSSSWCPPAGLLNRTPQEFYRDNHIWTRHRIFSMWEGACPACSGTVSTTFYMCDDHHVVDGTPCEHCGIAGTGFEAQWLFVCDVCKNTELSPGFAPMFASMAVRTFLYERGLDIEVSLDAGQRKRAFDLIEQIEVVSEDPLVVEVRAELDGDKLEVTLDDAAHVIEVTEATGDRA